MKIISKYKDYYDYLVGILGEDPLLIYKRDLNKIYLLKDLYLSNESEPKVLTFAINNILYHFVYYKGRFYHTPEELVTLNTFFKKGYRLKYHEESCTYGFKTLKGAKEFIKENLKTEVNSISREPVLIKVSYLQTNSLKIKNTYWKIPKLDEFPISKVLSPQFVYNQISEFLGWLNDNPEKITNLTDKEKIVSAGFDLKSSFRKK